MLTSSVLDHGFEPQSGQTQGYKIGNGCFSTKQTALKSENEHCMNQDNVSEWSGMSTRRLLFQ
jgi:hypothetical protein